MKIRMWSGLQPLRARIYTKYFADFIFIHINKTGGSSVERALGLPFQHRTAWEIRASIGERRWAERFTFSIVRNPWDRVASHYHYRIKTNQTGLGTKPIPFPDWVLLAYGDRDPKYHDKPKMFMPQTEWLVDEDGRILVDFVGRFERLEEDFRTICRAVGRTATLPHLKKTDRPDYRSQFTAEAAATVARCFAADLKNFGYSFD